MVGGPLARKEGKMRISYDSTRTMARGLMLTCVLLLLAGGWSTAAASEQDWLDAMVRAVLVEQAKEGGRAHRSPGRGRRFLMGRQTWDERTGHPVEQPNPVGQTRGRR